jgi:membrane fusion protein, copper/silver efflux system
MSNEEEGFAPAANPGRTRTMMAGGVIAALAVAGIGYTLLSRDDAAVSTAAKGGIANGVVQDGSGKTVLYWFDPMIPMERYKAPGKSSMNMGLQPKYAEEGGGAGVRISPAVQQNLGVRTVRVSFENMSAAIAAVGRVETDERRIFEVQTLTPGFVEQLSVRAVGEQVGSGTRVASVYSPELLGAQHEYVALLNIRPSTISPGLRNAARQRLHLLGLPEAAIRNLDRGGRPQRTYGVFAPRSGFVTAIGARPGARVEPGQSIITLADLSQVWIVAEIPEVSLGQIRVGQPAEISFPAYGSDTVQGRIDYIFPTLNAEARTARVRVTLPNPAGRLKIGMFANLTIGGAATGGLVVPAEAVISTGRRNVVIVQRDGGFIPVEVELGRTVGDKTHIRRGIALGDVVVVSGQFLIDSEASLAGVMERLTRGQSPAAQQQKRDERVQGRGVVKAIDGAGARITLAHEPIAAINWPAMTMAFPVRDRSLLRGRKAGERVTFAIQRPQPGQTPVIERIAPEAAQ